MTGSINEIYISTSQYPLVEERQTLDAVLVENEVFTLEERV